MYPSIERIRAQLAKHVTAPFAVSEKRTQWSFGEDSEAWCDIDVRDHAADRFVLVVIAGEAMGRRADFMARVWHHYCPEVWLVDPDAREVSVRRRDLLPAMAAPLIVPHELPLVTIDMQSVFIDD